MAIAAGKYIIRSALNEELVLQTAGKSKGAKVSTGSFTESDNRCYWHAAIVSTNYNKFYNVNAGTGTGYIMASKVENNNAVTQNAYKVNTGAWLAQLSGNTMTVNGVQVATYYLKHYKNQNLYLTVPDDGGDTYLATLDSGTASTIAVTVTGTIADTDNVNVNRLTFQAAVNNTAGTYTFLYDGTDWMLSGQTVSLSTYGITLTDTAANGDGISIVFTEYIESDTSNQEFYFEASTYLNKKLATPKTLTTQDGNTYTISNKTSTVSAAVSGKITGATVTKATFETKITTTGTYIFTYDGSNWKYNGTTVSMESGYGIKVKGTPANKDTVTVTYLAAGEVILFPQWTSSSSAKIYEMRYRYRTSDMEGNIASEATASVSGSITAATVVKETFETVITETGSYIFIYNYTDEVWKLRGDEVSLTDYGITVTGTPANNDRVIVNYVSSWGSWNGWTAIAATGQLNAKKKFNGIMRSDVMIKPPAVDNITYSKVETQVQVRLTSAKTVAAYNTSSVTHGPVVSQVITQYCYPSLTLSAALYSPDGLALAYTTDYTVSGSSIVIDSIMDGEVTLVKDFKFTGQDYAGDLYLNCNELYSVPNANDSIVVTATITEENGVAKTTVTETLTVIYDDSYGLLLEPTYALTERLTILAAVPKKDLMQLYLEHIQLDGTSLWVECDKVYDGFTAPTTSSNQNLTVETDSILFANAVNNEKGTYVFSYNGSNWTYSGNTVSIDTTYGITVTGTPSNGNTITVILNPIVIYEFAPPYGKAPNLMWVAIDEDANWTSTIVTLNDIIINSNFYSWFWVDEYAVPHAAILKYQYNKVMQPSDDITLGANMFVTTGREYPVFRYSKSIERVLDIEGIILKDETDAYSTRDIFESMAIANHCVYRQPDGKWYQVAIRSIKFTKEELYTTVTIEQEAETR